MKNHMVTPAYESFDKIKSNAGVTPIITPETIEEIKKVFLEFNQALDVLGQDYCDLPRKNWTQNPLSLASFERKKQRIDMKNCNVSRLAHA